MNPLPGKLVVIVLIALLGNWDMAKPAAKKAKPVKLTADQKKQVAGNTEFALDLYHQLQKELGKKGESSNLFFSPYSISTALAMTYGGARGETEKQMAEVLHFFPEQERLYRAFAALQKTMNEDTETRGYQLHVANALWGQKGYGFLPAFLDQTQKYYGAGLEELDFVSATEAARQTINSWVAAKTHQKIKDLIKPGVLNALTRLVLTNAVYFKGDWANPFKEKYTKEAPFYLSAEKSAPVPLMFQRESFGYAEYPEVQVLELPYTSDELSMIVMLPREADGLAKLEQSLTAKTLTQYLAKLRKKELLVYLPKFQLTCEFGLKTMLTAMGMRDAFNVRQANFTGMTSRDELFISAVIHKAFVEVNEEGTEAAAATGAVMSMKSAPLPPPVFRADHPFLFLIRDTRTNSILFMGRLVKPEAVK